MRQLPEESRAVNGVYCANTTSLAGINRLRFNISLARGIAPFSQVVKPKGRPYMQGQTRTDRIAEAPVEHLFIDRWSPRSFADTALTDDEISTMFEGARWAPSSFNRQPWLFVYETDGPDRALFNSILFDRNQLWASKAPLLGFIFARTVDDDGRELRTAEFDTGAAWMGLALSAATLGIYTHGMAGIDRDAAHVKLGVPSENWKVMCGFAAGRIGPKDALPAEMQAVEAPSGRNSQLVFVRKGATP